MLSSTLAGVAVQGSPPRPAGSASAFQPSPGWVGALGMGRTVAAGSSARGKQCCPEGEGMKPTRGQTSFLPAGWEMGEDQGPKGILAVSKLYE